jgi:hypothetical protein
LSKQTIESKHPDYDRMARRWEAIDALRGGTLEMRDLATGSTALDPTQYLPREKKEEDEHFRARVNRSFLYGMLTDTVKATASKPFARPIAIDIDGNEETKDQVIPTWLEAVMKNADGTGTALHDVLKAMLSDSLYHGLSHLLVDVPREFVARDGTVRQVTRDTELTPFVDGSVRPTITLVRSDALFNWRKRVVGGESRIVHARIRECVSEDSGEWGSDEIEQIRVYDAASEQVAAETIGFLGGQIDASRGVWSIWRKKNGSDWHVHDAGQFSFPTIPIFTHYSDRIGMLCANPPFEELAWVNIAHWQRFSDYMTACRHAAVAHLWGRGVTTEERKRIEAGGVAWNRFISLESPNGQIAIAEHSGQSIGSIERCLDRLEARGEVLGMRPSIEKVGTTTATAARLNAASTHTQLQAWATDLETVAMSALRAAAQMIGDERSANLSVSVFSDFDAAVGSTEMLDWVLKARAAREITRATALREYKRLGALSAEVDVSAEEEMLESESMELLPSRARSNQDPESEAEDGEDQDEENEDGEA